MDTDAKMKGAALAPSAIVHTTLTGHELRYDPDPVFGAFLERLRGMLADPDVGEQAMIGLAYSRANPILAARPGDLAGDRGYVTREVLSDPRYGVVADLLARKRFAVTGTDPARAAEAYTLPAAEAARRLGLTPSAMQQAFAEGRIATWIKDGRPYATPNGVDAYGLTLATSGKKRSGPAPRAPVTPAGSPPPTRLFIRTGHSPEGVFKVKHPGELQARTKVDHDAVEGYLDTWQRVGVLVGSGPTARFYELVPGEGAGETLSGAGGFFLRGAFKVARTVESARQSRLAWSAFEPA